MNKLDQLQQQLQTEQVRIVTIQHQFEGNKKLYEAAAVSGDNKRADEVRQNLHTILDMQLDTMASVGLLTRAMIEEVIRSARDQGRRRT